MIAHTEVGLSSVTAILPQQYADVVIESLIAEPGTSALIWNARGTLLHDKWYRQMLPTISPAKVMLQLLIPRQQLDAVLAIIIEQGKLNMQGAGAVFASPCEHLWAGSSYHDWPASALEDEANADHPGLLELKADLSVIYCVIERDQTRAVSRAAVDAGAHGPIVFYGEGHGLRDHLGWLRITKQSDKEILTVLVDEAKAREVFSAMATAAEMHLPGRGYMFMMPQERGLFNLPSRASVHAYEANMQQIINAIDNLTGHTHWRDQSAYSVTDSQRQAAGKAKRNQQNYRTDQCSVCAVVDRDDVNQLTDMMLAAGASGMQISHARFAANEEGCEFAGAKINKEYAILRSVLGRTEAAEISEKVKHAAEEADLCDICMFLQPVPLVASYVPGIKDYRAQPLLDSISTRVQAGAANAATKVP